MILEQQERLNKAREVAWQNILPAGDGQVGKEDPTKMNVEIRDNNNKPVSSLDPIKIYFYIHFYFNYFGDLLCKMIKRLI